MTDYIKLDLEKAFINFFPLEREIANIKLEMLINLDKFEISPLEFIDDCVSDSYISAILIQYILLMINENQEDDLAIIASKALLEILTSISIENNNIIFNDSSSLFLLFFINSFSDT